MPGSERKAAQFAQLGRLLRACLRRPVGAHELTQLRESRAFCIYIGHDRGWWICRDFLRGEGNVLGAAWRLESALRQEANYAGGMFGISGKIGARSSALMLVESRACR